MVERFKDFAVFVGWGALLSSVAFFVAMLWLAASSPSLSFSERWAPALNMPAALELHHKQRPAEIPVFFCGSRPFQCRTV